MNILTVIIIIMGLSDADIGTLLLGASFAAQAWIVLRQYLTLRHMTSRDQPTARVAAITIYPIKSCAGVAIEASRVDYLGLAGDRRYMLVDKETNEFVSIRKFPKLTLIRPRLEFIMDSNDDVAATPTSTSTTSTVTTEAKLNAGGSDGSSVVVLDGGGHSRPQTTQLQMKPKQLPQAQLPQPQPQPQPQAPRLVVEMAGHPSGPLLVPSETSGETIDVTVWSDTFSAETVSEECDKWFTDALGCSSELRLVVVRPKTAHARRIRRALRSEYTNSGAQVAFQDVSPLLLLSRESVGDVKARVKANNTTGVQQSPPPPPAAVSAINFRPNIIVEGCSRAWEEDSWRRVRVGGGVIFDIVEPCGRCMVPSVDPDTGHHNRRFEPVPTLRTYRQCGELVFVGQHMVPAHDEGIVRVGDAVEVLSVKRDPITSLSTRWWSWT